MTSVARRLGRFGGSASGRFLAAGLSLVLASSLVASACDSTPGKTPASGDGGAAPSCTPGATFDDPQCPCPGQSAGPAACSSTGQVHCLDCATASGAGAAVSSATGYICECPVCCAQDCCACPKGCDDLADCYACVDCVATGDGCGRSWEDWASFECEFLSPPGCEAFVACIDACRTAGAEGHDCEVACTSAYPEVGCDFYGWVQDASASGAVSCPSACTPLAAAVAGACNPTGAGGAGQGGSSGSEFHSGLVSDRTGRKVP